MIKAMFMYVLFSLLFLFNFCGYAMDNNPKPSSVQAQKATEVPTSVGDTASTDDDALCAYMDQFETDYFGNELAVAEPPSGEGIDPDQVQTAVPSSSSSSSTTTTMPFGKKRAFGINGSMQCYFSLRDNIIAYLVDYIQEAKIRICVAVYQFRAMELARALARAHARGVDVYVICDHCAKNNWAIQFLITCGIKVFVWNTDRSKALMHHKFALIDDDIVLDGSFNWTPNANDNNCENLIAMKNQEMYEEFFYEFCEELLPSSFRLQVTQGSDQPNPKKRNR